MQGWQWLPNLLLGQQGAGSSAGAAAVALNSRVRYLLGPAGPLVSDHSWLLGQRMGRGVRFQVWYMGVVYHTVSRCPYRNMDVWCCAAAVCDGRAPVWAIISR